MFFTLPQNRSRHEIEKTFETFIIRMRCKGTRCTSNPFLGNRFDCVIHGKIVFIVMSSLSHAPSETHSPQKKVKDKLTAGTLSGSGCIRMPPQACPQPG